MKQNEKERLQKIIHVDMDCFYAAVEIRDQPELKNKPVAVGGSPENRGVLCTCNYIARQQGIRSAMPTSMAYRMCPELIVLPVNMKKYRAVSKKIHDIFSSYSDCIEPLALDEAYLDVTHSEHHHGSGTLIAKAIRERIWNEEQLIASAGVAPNKFLAKIASGWKKPNGLFVIRPEDIDEFIVTLPVTELFGVGKVTAEKLHRLNLKTCADLQKVPQTELIQRFGKMGKFLYDQCRGRDQRSVEPHRIRKSLSVETTLRENIKDMEPCIAIITELFQRLLFRLQEYAADRVIKNYFIKIKFSNFKSISAESVGTMITLEQFISLFCSSYSRGQGAIRLVGIGVHFQVKNNAPAKMMQQILF